MGVGGAECHSVAIIYVRFKFPPVSQSERSYYVETEEREDQEGTAYNYIVCIQLVFSI